MLKIPVERQAIWVRTIPLSSPLISHLAPEVKCRQNHGPPVDYYAVGVIAYECMMGRRPYNGRSRKDIRD